MAAEKNTALAAAQTESSVGHEPAADASVLASLGINGTLFVFQLVNFAIVALIVWFLMLKPLTKKMDERKKIIGDSLDKAKEIETNLVMSEQKFQERIDEAKVEANKVIEASFREAEQLGLDMKARAKKEIETLIDQAKHNIAIEKENMMREVEQNAGNLIVMALEKILREKMDEKKDKKLIEEMLNDLRK